MPPVNRTRGATRVTMREGIRRVLGRSRGPMHVATIADRVLRMPGVSSRGATPEATIAAILATENLKPDGEFVRVAPATYDLRSRVPASTRRSRPRSA